MRTVLCMTWGFLVCGNAVVEAGIPGPGPSCGLSGAGVACQHRFRLDGGLDSLTLRLTLLDFFGNPVPNCSTTATLVNTGSGTLCTCCGNRESAITDAMGLATFLFRKIGGRGSGEVRVTAHCPPSIAICHTSFDFTSTDLDGDCIDTDVIDLGLWASGLPPNPYRKASDYDCNGTVNIVDLGLFAGGIGVDCADGAPCP